MHALVVGWSQKILGLLCKLHLEKAYDHINLDLLYLMECIGNVHLQMNVYFSKWKPNWIFQ